VNCDECKEQVLELIEREAVDPEGVRETLDKCPECKLEFEAVKAQLALATQLPLEAPPDHLDVLILQAAEARTAGVAPAIDALLAEQGMTEASAPGEEARPRLFLWRQPLAMAAVALLVVGIGVSTVSIVRGPGQQQLAEAPAVDDHAAEAAQPKGLEEEVGGAGAERLELAQASLDDVVAREAAAEPPAPRKARASGARPRKKKGVRGAGRDDAPARVALAEADLAAAPAARQYDASELASLEAGESKSASSSREANGPKGATTEEERQCTSTILVFEKRQKDNPNFEPTPEQALDAGLCYQRLGRRNDAERWLKRAAEHRSTKARATEALKKLE
jgi:hypothetical protein